MDPSKTNLSCQHSGGRKGAGMRVGRKKKTAKWKNVAHEQWEGRWKEKENSPSRRIEKPEIKGRRS